MHNFGSLEYKDPQTVSHSRISMLSSTILEAGSWTIPALVQDLASIFGSEPTPQNLATGSGATSTVVSPPLKFNRSPLQIHSPMLLSDGLWERKPKMKTKYLLAHPPPVSRSKQRLSSRPRMIFQLQRVSDTFRPLPAFDVISSTAIVSRFARRVPKVMKGGSCPTTDDVVLVRSEMYGQDSIADGDTTDQSGDETTSNHPEILGTICYARKAKDGSLHPDEICLENGLTWEATCLKVGVYEFSGKSHNGLKLRWVSRRARKRTTKRNSLGEPATKPSNSRFTFSIMNPNTRLHPVIATLSEDNKLDILDRFPTCVSSASASPSSSNPRSPLSSEFSSDTSYFDRPFDSESLYMETDEALRMLIILTGIWVMSQEGWPGIFLKSSDVINPSRQDSPNGSPSTAISRAETDLERSPQPRRRPFRIHRSSTSPPSQREARKESAPLGRAESTRPSGTRRVTVNVPQPTEGSMPLLPSTLCCAEDEVELRRTTDIARREKTSSLALGPLSDAINRHDRMWAMNAKDQPRVDVMVPASALNVNQLGHGFVEREAVKEAPEKDGLKLRPKKLVRLHAACKSLLGPCTRVS